MLEVIPLGVAMLALLLAGLALAKSTDAIDWMRRAESAFYDHRQRVRADAVLHNSACDDRLRALRDEIDELRRRP